MKLSVTMANLSTTVSSSSAYIRILPSGIAANLVQYGTSMITHGYEQDLILDPGKYSVDFDQEIFNATVRTSSLYSIDLLLCNRTGNMNIIVEFMVNPSFHIFPMHS